MEEMLTKVLRLFAKCALSATAAASVVERKFLVPATRGQEPKTEN